VKKSRKNDPEPTRRSFLTWAGVGLAGGALVEAGWIAASFLRPGDAGGERGGAGGVIVAGPLDSFEPGSVTAFPAGMFYLVRLEEGGFLALHRRCTHLGCTVPWDEERRRFACPCHSSEFDIRGEVLSPPAPRPLDFLPVRIENDIVKVDASRPTRRSRFDASQVGRP